MPGNLARAKPDAVWPKMFYSSYNVEMWYPMLTQTYHNGETERSLITDATPGFFGGNLPVALRKWSLAAKLRNYVIGVETTSPLQDFKNFWDVHQGIAFYFYDPFDAAPDPVGSNWDPTGNITEGRYTVIITSQSWNERTVTGRTEVTGIELLEVDNEVLVKSLG